MADMLEPDPGPKEEALARCRAAAAAELQAPGFRDALIEEARDAGARMDEIEAALDAEPEPVREDPAPPHGDPLS